MLFINNLISDHEHVVIYKAGALIGPKLIFHPKIFVFASQNLAKVQEFNLEMFQPTESWFDDNQDIPIGICQLRMDENHLVGFFKHNQTHWYSTFTYTVAVWNRKENYKLAQWNSNLLADPRPLDSNFMVRNELAWKPDLHHGTIIIPGTIRISGTLKDFFIQVRIK